MWVVCLRRADSGTKCRPLPFSFICEDDDDEDENDEEGDEDGYDDRERRQGFTSVALAT